MAADAPAGAGAVEPVDAANSGVTVKSLTYAFPGGEPFLNDFSLELPRGSRCLLIGCNGSGKTTLLQILAGKFMVNPDMVRILGRPPFHDLDLAAKGELAYLGHQWRRSVASAGSDVPMQGDIDAGTLIYNIKDVDPVRRDMLIKLLDINLAWRLHQVSDGQRRRVQMCMGLLKPFKVLLLDEVTVDMDVLGRLELLRFFKRETEERGCTIVYATHIFDGLSDWMTHVAFVSDGAIVRGGPSKDIPELAGDGKMLPVASKWLRAERDRLKLLPAKTKVVKAKADIFGARHMAFYR